METDPPRSLVLAEITEDQLIDYSVRIGIGLPQYRTLRVNREDEKKPWITVLGESRHRLSPLTEHNLQWQWSKLRPLPPSLIVLCANTHEEVMAETLIRERNDVLGIRHHLIEENLRIRTVVHHQPVGLSACNRIPSESNSHGYSSIE